MSMSDWNDKKTPGFMTLSSAQKHEGEKSLEIPCLIGNEAIKILTMSEAANPKSVFFDFWGHIRGSGYSTYCESCITMFMRYQDTANYYFFSINGYSKGGSDLTAKLGIMKAGVITWSSEISGLGSVAVWYHYKLEMCEISNVLYASIYREEAGEWVLKGTKALSPAEFTSGGGCGVGTVEFLGKNCSGTFDAYLDSMKIYY